MLGILELVGGWLGRLLLCLAWCWSIIVRKHQVWLHHRSRHQLCLHGRWYLGALPYLPGICLVMWDVYSTYRGWFGPLLYSLPVPYICVSSSIPPPWYVCKSLNYRAIFESCVTVVTDALVLSEALGTGFSWNLDDVENRTLSWHTRFKENGITSHLKDFKQVLQFQDGRSNLEREHCLWPTSAKGDTWLTWILQDLALSFHDIDVSSLRRSLATEGERTCQASREISTSGPSAMAGESRTTVNKTTTDLRTTTVSRTTTDNRTTTVLRTTSFHRTTASSRGSTRTTGRSLTTGSTRTTTDSNRATTGSTTRTRTTGLTRTTKTTASSLDATRCLPSSSRPQALKTQVLAAGVFVFVFVFVTL